MVGYEPSQGPNELVPPLAVLVTSIRLEVTKNMFGVAALFATLSDMDNGFEGARVRAVCFQTTIFFFRGGDGSLRLASRTAPQPPYVLQFKSCGALRTDGSRSVGGGWASAR